MKDLNLALISKLGWMMLSPTPRPWVKYLSAKYLKHFQFLHVEPRVSSSWAWKGILKSRPFIAQGRCFLVGNGDTIRTWMDPWIPSLPSFVPKPKNGLQRLNSASLVSHFIIASSRSWDVNLLQNTFDYLSINSIRQLHLPPAGTSDKMVWTPDMHGFFTVKSAYRQLSFNQSSILGSGPSINWKKLWRLNMHERLKVLLWKVACDILPTRHKIAQYLKSSFQGESSLWG